MIKIANSAITFLLLIILQSACLDEPDCFGLNNNQVGITFKDIITSENISIENVAVLADTILIIDTAATSKIVVPLNYFQQSTSFTIPARDTVYQLILGYKSQSQFVSEGCGARFVIEDLSITSHGFDSVRLVNATPGKNDEVLNIEIFW